MVLRVCAGRFLYHLFSAVAPGARAEVNARDFSLMMASLSRSVPRQRDAVGKETNDNISHVEVAEKRVVQNKRR